MDLLSLSVGGAAGVALARGIARTREHRTAAIGLSDLLNWGFMVDDGVILQKDGSLLAGWRYGGPDLNSATAEEMDSLTRHLNDLLLPLTDSWMFHVDAIRRPATAYARSQFPDPITQVIDDERRAAYETEGGRQFETEFFLLVTHLPPADAISRLGSFFVQGNDRADADWSHTLGMFRNALNGIEDRLVSRLRLRRLESDALLTHLHECLTGKHHQVTAPAAGSYLNIVLSEEPLVGGFEPRIGENHLRAVAITGYPHATRAGQTEFLNVAPFSFRWSNRIIPLGMAEAAKQIRRQQLQWFKKRKGAGAWMQEMVSGGKDKSPKPDDDLWLDNDARGMARDASDAASENASGMLRFCYFTQVVIIADVDPYRADHTAAQILKALNDGGFSGRIETVNALEAYLGTLPGHGYPNLRRPLLSTRNIADLLPVTSVWPGLATNPCSYFPPDSPPLMWAATSGATPFRVNLHDSDVGHTLVLGKTGSGKSVLLAMLAAQFRRYANAQVFAFDVGYSMWGLAAAIGAPHYDFAAARVDALRLQPLGGVDEPAERAWAAEWLECLVSLQGTAITPPLRQRIRHAVELLARNERMHRTLSELSVHFQHEALSGSLRPYTVAGNYGELLDGTSDDLSISDFQVFEMKHLMDLDDRIALPVLLYLFHRLEQRLDGRPTLIIIDEAWMPLTHSLFGARINQWLLTLRKQNAAVLLATQSPAQLERLPNRHTILDSCPTRFYLPNAEATTQAQSTLYEDLGLNARELAIIVGATPKRQYYFKSPRGSRLFDLGVTPFALAFLASVPGASMEETKRRMESMIAIHGDDWATYWLEERGLSEAVGKYEAARRNADHLRREQQRGSRNEQLLFELLSGV